MGVTVDLIPRLPSESSEDAIGRIYDGGIMIVIDNEAHEGHVEEIATGVGPAPDGAFAEWRAEVLRRLYELFPGWSSEDVGGYPHLWTAGYGWQVEFSSDDITLRARKSVDADAPGPDDASLLAAFEGLRTIIHWPDDHGSYCDLDDPDDRPALIG